MLNLLFIWELNLQSQFFNWGVVGISLFLHKYLWQKDKIFVSTCQPYFFPLIVHISAVHCSPRSLMMRPPIDTNAHKSQWKPIPVKTIQYQICIRFHYNIKFASHYNTKIPAKTIQYQICIRLHYNIKFASHYNTKISIFNIVQSFYVTALDPRGGLVFCGLQALWPRDSCLRHYWRKICLNEKLLTIGGCFYYVNIAQT